MAIARRLLNPIGFMVALLVAFAPLRELSYANGPQLVTWTALDAANGLVGSGYPQLSASFKVFPSEPFVWAALLLVAVGIGLASSRTDRFARRWDALLAAVAGLAALCVMVGAYRFAGRTADIARSIRGTASAGWGLWVMFTVLALLCIANAGSALMTTTTPASRGDRDNLPESGLSSPA